MSIKILRAVTCSKRSLFNFVIANNPLRQQILCSTIVSLLIFHPQPCAHQCETRAQHANTRTTRKHAPSNNKHTSARWCCDWESWCRMGIWVRSYDFIAFYRALGHLSHTNPPPLLTPLPRSNHIDAVQSAARLVMSKAHLTARFLYAGDLTRHTKSSEESYELFITDFASLWIPIVRNESLLIFYYYLQIKSKCCWWILMFSQRPPLHTHIYICYIIVICNNTD